VHRLPDCLESIPLHRLLKSVRFWWPLPTVLFALCVATAAQAGEPYAAVLILQSDEASIADRLAHIKSSTKSLQARRQAICLLRHETFTKRATKERTRLLEAVPPALATEIRFEPLPVLNAWLVFLPPSSAEQALPAWRAVLERTGAALYRLGDVSDDTLLSAATPGDHASCARELTAESRGNKGSVLGIIDTRPDITHPMLQTGLGEIYLENEDTAPGKVSTAHGTAMLGLYAQAAQGRSLSSQGHPLRASVAAPAPIKATVAAVAGPETPEGQARFVHALHWLLSAEDGRPFPDLLNYSQGNGLLCIEETDAGCQEDGGTGITHLLDRAIDDYALVAVKSAGNKHWGRTHTMTAPGATWNGLTVGNMHPFDWQRCGPGGSRRQHKIYRTSSVGSARPRLIDLVAPGVRLDTAAPGNQPMLSTGTSPAAAVVGVAALRLMGTGLRDPLRIKAVLINSAETWTSSGAPSPAARGHSAPCGTDTHAPTHGPYAYGARHDRSYGWGYLNEKRALGEARHARSASLFPGERLCYAVQAKAHDKFTLAWMRTPDSPALALKLVEAEGAFALIDEDADPAENLLQVSNGRGAGSPAREGKRLLVVSSAATPTAATRGTDLAQPFALASARPLVPLEKCPHELPAAP